MDGSIQLPGPILEPATLEDPVSVIGNSSLRTDQVISLFKSYETAFQAGAGGYHRQHRLLPGFLLQFHPNNVPENLCCLNMEAETSLSDMLNGLPVHLISATRSFCLL